MLLYVLNSRGKIQNDGTSEGNIHTLGELNTTLDIARPAARSIYSEDYRTSTRGSGDEPVREPTQVNLNLNDDEVGLTFIPTMTCSYIEYDTDTT